MIVYPAIDIRQGKVVRLLYGDPTIQSVYSDDPLAVAQRWHNAGAEWLHLISLDGALGESAPALDAVRQLAQTGLAIQFGGGLRTLDDAEQALKAGATRVILGTLVVNNPILAGEAVRYFGSDAVVIALDARDNRVVSEGWQEESDWSPSQLGKRLASDGVRYFLYTDVRKDGDLSGVNLSATVELALQTQANVIASGGVNSLLDIVNLKRTGCVEGVVVGRALYSNIFTLEEALEAARQG